MMTVEIHPTGLPGSDNRLHGRPRTASLIAAKVLCLKAERVSHSEIARRLGIGRTSVQRILAAG
jgi:DNA invertase Pin-like site-specific DNA recombinase